MKTETEIEKVKEFNQELEKRIQSFRERSIAQVSKTLRDLHTTDRLNAATPFLSKFDSMIRERHAEIQKVELLIDIASEIQSKNLGRT